MTFDQFINKYGNNALITDFGMTKQTVYQYLNSLPEWALTTTWEVVKGRKGKFARVTAMCGRNIGVLCLK